MRSPIRLAAVVVFALGAVASGLTGHPGPVIAALVGLALGWLVWMPVGAFRWASRELTPQARKVWLALNVVVLAAGTFVMTNEMLVFSLIVANVSIWLSFAVARVPIVLRGRAFSAHGEPNRA